MEKSVLNDAVVLGRTAQGADIHATVKHMTRFMAVFELYNAGVVFHASEVLTDFRIVVQSRPVYSGRATIKNIVDTGLVLVCEVTLDDSWLDVDLWTDRTGAKIKEEFKRFFEGWQNVYRVSPEYKCLAADMHTFLSDLRLWLEQVEVGIRALPDGDRGEVERQLADQISQSVFACLDSLFEQFETIASRIPEDQRPGHEAYIKRLIHPLILSSPFAFRSVQKPLGYAGDYGMVNMILGDPHQGGSLFGKVLNRWFIKQPPAEAHRNRIKYLTQKLVEETARVSAQSKRSARIYNVGCGPAGEVLNFLNHEDVCDRADFTLLDFNDETLAHARNILETARRQNRRATPMQFVKKSVFQILKGKGKSVEGPSATKYDLIYCAGLFDYLNDQVCLQLTELLYDMLAPGGLLITTNVDVSNPIQHWLGSILEWHLIYRNSRQYEAFGKDLPNCESIRIWGDETSVNLFFEARKAGP